MSGTFIAPWQMVGVEGNRDPFYFTVKAEINQAILDETKWVDEPGAFDVQYWKRFRTMILTSVDPKFEAWNASPDETFNILWSDKYAQLCRLYTMIHTLYVKYSYDPYQMEVYREKVEQAVDYLAEGQGELSNYPLLQADSEIYGDNDGLDTARRILSKRSEWIGRMADVERIRIPAKRDILKAGTRTDAVATAQIAIQKLQKMDEEWT